MEKFVLELIKENNRVIIPNFGAFIISKEDGINILFNNFLSFNDGLLVNYVAEKKGLDTVVATEEVFTYVDNLKKQLDDTGEYGIKGLGSFKKDDTGILRFFKDPNFIDLYKQESPVYTESIKETPTEEPEKEELSVNEEITETDNTDLLDIDNSEEIEAIESPVKEIESVSNEPILTIDEEEEEIISQDLSKKEEEKVPLKEEPTIKTETSQNKITQDKSFNSFANTSSSPATESKPKEKTIEKPTAVVNKKPQQKTAQVTKKEKKNKNAVILLVLLLVLIAGIAAYILFIQNPAKEKAKKHIQEIKIEKQNTIINDTLPKVAPEPEPVDETPVPADETPTVTSNVVYIIIGGFKEEQNAVKLVEKYKNKGYDKAQIISKGNLFLVSIDADESYQKMEQRQQEILENEKIDSWMYSAK